MMKKLILFMVSFFVFLNISFASDVDVRTKGYIDKGINSTEAKIVIYRLLGLDREPVVEAFAEENKKEYAGSVYLTFDDGPTKEITTQILDILKEYDVKATFFSLGEYIDRNPEITKRAYEEGHEIASHSYTHKKAMFSSLETFKSEITKTEEAIFNAIGITPDFFRVPYGTKLGQEYKDYLSAKGYEMIGWNCESYDSRGSHIKAADILKGVKDTSKNKKEVIVIMHDTYGKQETVKALPDVIEYFQSINYEFKKIGE